jgi:PgaD-like protein
MKARRPPVEPPIIRTRVPAWMQVRDVLLTLGAWLLIGYFLREGLYLAYDYFRAPIFELSTATAPDWSEVWGRLRGFVLLAATLVLWITFWALDSRARLQATHSPQPAPLPDGKHAARFGLGEAELAAGRLAKVQTVDIDPARQVVIRLDGRVRNVGAER